MTPVRPTAPAAVGRPGAAAGTHGWIARRADPADGSAVGRHRRGRPDGAGGPVAGIADIGILGPGSGAPALGSMTLGSTAFGATAFGANMLGAVMFGRSGPDATGFGAAGFGAAGFGAARFGAGFGSSGATRPGGLIRRVLIGTTGRSTAGTASVVAGDGRSPGFGRWPDGRVAPTRASVAAGARWTLRRAVGLAGIRLPGTSWSMSMSTSGRQSDRAPAGRWRSGSIVPARLAFPPAPVAVPARSLTRPDVVTSDARASAMLGTGRRRTDAVRRGRAPAIVDHGPVRRSTVGPAVVDRSVARTPIGSGPWPRATWPGGADSPPRSREPAAGPTAVRASDGSGRVDAGPPWGPVTGLAASVAPLPASMTGPSASAAGLPSSITGLPPSVSGLHSSVSALPASVGLSSTVGEPTGGHRRFRGDRTDIAPAASAATTRSGAPGRSAVRRWAESLFRRPGDRAASRPAAATPVDPTEPSPIGPAAGRRTGPARSTWDTTSSPSARSAGPRLRPTGPPGRTRSVAHGLTLTVGQPLTRDRAIRRLPSIGATRTIAPAAQAAALRPSAPGRATVRQWAGPLLRRRPIEPASSGDAGSTSVHPWADPSRARRVADAVAGTARSSRGDRSSAGGGPTGRSSARSGPPARTRSTGQAGQAEQAGHGLTLTVGQRLTRDRAIRRLPSIGATRTITPAASGRGTVRPAAVLTGDAAATVRRSPSAHPDAPPDRPTEPGTGSPRRAAPGGRPGADTGLLLRQAIPSAMVIDAVASTMIRRMPPSPPRGTPRLAPHRERVRGPNTPPSADPRWSFTSVGATAERNPTGAIIGDARSRGTGAPAVPAPTTDGTASPAPSRRPSLIDLVPPSLFDRARAGLAASTGGTLPSVDQFPVRASGFGQGAAASTEVAQVTEPSDNAAAQRQRIAEALAPREWDELVDVIVDRLEERIRDELARRGRRFTPGVF